MTEGLDTSTPNVARMYDYLLGGKDNFAADRAAAEHLLALIPDVAAIARDNREFVSRAVRFLAGEAGISQFLDLGGGLPTQSNVHEVAQQVNPSARVVYVDHDPVVVRHGEALLASRDPAHVGMVRGDLTVPGQVLSDPGVHQVLDLRQPVAILCTSVLHFITDPYPAIAEFRDTIAPGSYLVITHAPSRVPGADPEGDADSATSVYSAASAPLVLRTFDEIERLFDGFELVEPGVVWMSQWRPGEGWKPSGRIRSLRAGVGRKPR